MSTRAGEFPLVGHVFDQFFTLFYGEGVVLWVLLAWCSVWLNKKTLKINHNWPSHGIALSAEYQYFSKVSLSFHWVNPYSHYLLWTAPSSLSTPPSTDFSGNFKCCSEKLSKSRRGKPGAGAVLLAEAVLRFRCFSGSLKAEKLIVRWV